MASMTDFLENKLLDWLLRAQAFSVSGASAGAASGMTSVYVGLLTAAPSDTGGGTEVSGGSYARQQITSALANWAGTQSAGSTTASSGTGGTTSNNNVVTFPTPSANWGSITHVGLYDASSGGNLLFWAALTTPKTVNNGDPAPTFAAAALTLQIDN